MERPSEIICNGPSMKPTLMPGDKIETEIVAFDELRPGDIIVYNSPDNIRLNIIHRVTGGDADGLITRGDNNSHTDSYRVRPEHRPLKVIAIERGARHITIGKHGMILHRLRMLQRKIRVFKRKYLYPVYAFVADSRIFYPVGCLFKTEIRKFKRPKGIEFQLFIGKHRVGVLYPRTEKWYINFPWRMFIKPPEPDKE
jgi:Signal peptidase, peptidase S26